MSTVYRPPFIWFGGKSAVAETVWSALGDVTNYVEPFFGSGAVLFLRDGIGNVETVNDADGFVANFWRSVAANPDAVADHADWPVNEADLHARHLWLLGQRERITDRLMGDPEYFDVKVAGWWVWGINCWIGSGWCSGNGPWVSRDGVMVRRDDNESQQGVKRKLPHLGCTGKGVNRQLPNPVDRRAWLRWFLGEYAQRLARVRVCCGDWSRVCGPSVTFKHGITGVFLDPPYADTAKRTGGLYAVDSESVAHDVREWAVESGKRPDMRIVLAGYEGEHEMPSSWRVFEWEAKGGYSLANEDEDGFGRQNKKRERLWMSPACIAPKTDSLWGTT